MFFSPSLLPCISLAVMRRCWPSCPPPLPPTPPSPRQSPTQFRPCLPSTDPRRIPSRHQILPSIHTVPLNLDWAEMQSGNAQPNLNLFPRMSLDFQYLALKNHSRSKVSEVPNERRIRGSETTPYQVRTLHPSSKTFGEARFTPPPEEVGLPWEAGFLPCTPRFGSPPPQGKL